MNRREWLASLGFATLAACSRNKGTGYYGYALVADAQDNSLTAIDLTAFRFASSIPLPASPSRLLSVANQAFALTPSNGTVHGIDGNLKRTRSKRLAGVVDEMALTPDTKSLLALASQSRELIQLRVPSLDQMARHKLSIAADVLDVSTAGYAAVANAHGEVELLNLASGQRTRTQTPQLGAIRFRGDGKLLLAANRQNRSLLALDVPSLTVVAELPLAMQPDQLCFNSDQGQLFVSGEGMDGVAVVFPYNTLEVDQTLLAGRTPGAMACSAVPAFLFVGSRSASNVCILNIDTRKVIGLVDMGGHASFIKITPDNQYALVFDGASGDMGVIHVPAIRESGDARRLRTGAALFTMLNAGKKPVDAAVIARA